MNRMIRLMMMVKITFMIKIMLVMIIEVMLTLMLTIIMMMTLREVINNKEIALQIAQISYCWAIIDEIMQTLSYFQQMWVMYVRKLLKRGPRTRRGRRNRRCQQQIIVDDGNDEDHDKTNHKEKKAMMMLLLLPFPNCCDREELASQIAGKLLRFDGFLKTGIGLKY